MSKQPTPQAPPSGGGGLPTGTLIGLIPSFDGWEIYNPADDNATPVPVIAWQVMEDGGAIYSWPITPSGTAPNGWLPRHRIAKITDDAASAAASESP